MQRYTKRSSSHRGNFYVALQGSCARVSYGICEGEPGAHAILLESQMQPFSPLAE